MSMCWWLYYSNTLRKSTIETRGTNCVLYSWKFFPTARVLIGYFEVKWHPTMKLGAFHYAKISGNFGPNENGTVRPRRKFSGQSGPPPEVVKSFRNFRFQFRSSSSLYTVVKMTDGLDVSVYECSVGKPQTQDLNFLLIGRGGGGLGGGGYSLA